MGSASDRGGQPLQSAIHRFQTRNVDKAAEHLETIYGRTARWGGSRHLDEFSVAYEVASLGAVRLMRVDLTGFDLTRTLTDSVQIIVPLRSCVTLASGGETRTGCAADKNAVVTKANEQTRHSIKSGAGLLLVLQTSELIDRAAQLTATPQDERSMGAMRDRLDLDEPVAGALSRNMRSAFAELQSLDAIGMGGLAQRGYEELLLNLAVSALYPSIARCAENPPPSCGSPLVRKARDWIEAHATEAIEIARLAADLGVSMRTLQDNFQRHYGYSPRDFVLECRLVLARQALSTPETNTRTVTDIAFASGFSDLSHFSAKYRDKYGELPSDTLRAARG